LPADWPEPLRQTVARALSPNPEVRFKTAAEFAAALQDFRSGLAPTPDAEATRRVFQNGDATVRTQQVPPFTPVFPLPEAEATRRTAREQSPPPVPTHSFRPWRV